MSFIEIKANGPDIPEGVYPVLLTEIAGPKVVTAQRGPNAGKDIELLDWKFVIDTPGQPYDETPIEASTSTASGPRSKMFAYLTALFGGVAPPVGTRLERDQIVGRSALATVQKDADGWLRITNLGAAPVTHQSAAQVPAQPAPAPEPVAATASPVREAVARASGDLPF